MPLKSLTGVVLEKYREKIDTLENDLARDEVGVLNSLGLYGTLRCWTPISEDYAWARTHKNRQSHRYLEHYLDDWGWKSETLMKLRFRTGCDRLNWRISRLNNTPVADSHCLSCAGEDAPETVSHYVMHCSAYAVQRREMFDKVGRTLERYDDLENVTVKSQDFMRGSINRKLRILLGERTGMLKVNRSIDRYFKKFLKATVKIRNAATLGADI